MRFLYKPRESTLWGFHQPYIQNYQATNVKDEISAILDELDDENEVEMNKTMWLVLRKTRP